MKKLVLNVLLLGGLYCNVSFAYESPVFIPDAVEAGTRMSKELKEFFFYEKELARRKIVHSEYVDFTKDFFCSARDGGRAVLRVTYREGEQGAAFFFLSVQTNNYSLEGRSIRNYATFIIDEVRKLVSHPEITQEAGHVSWSLETALDHEKTIFDKDYRSYSSPYVSSKLRLSKRAKSSYKFDVSIDNRDWSERKIVNLSCAISDR